MVCTSRFTDRTSARTILIGLVVLLAAGGPTFPRSIAISPTVDVLAGKSDAIAVGVVAAVAVSPPLQARSGERMTIATVTATVGIVRVVAGVVGDSRIELCYETLPLDPGTPQAELGAGETALLFLRRLGDHRYALAHAVFGALKPTSRGNYALDLPGREYRVIVAQGDLFRLFAKYPLRAGGTQTWPTSIARPFVSELGATKTRPIPFSRRAKSSSRASGAGP